MNTSFQFDRSFAGPEEYKYNFDYWGTVIDLYDQQLYKESFIALLRYINESLITKYGNTDQSEFNIPHGSTSVHIKVGKTIELSTPFVNLPDTTSVPLMRQVAQLNFSPLTLSTAVLSDKQLILQYSCPIELAEPNKMYYTMKEMCQEADNNDDRFIELFKASYVKEPKIQRYSPEQLEMIWAKVQSYVDQGLTYMEHFEAKRMGFYFDILVCTFMQIDYYAAPQGFVHSEIDRAIQDIQDSYEDMGKRIQYGKTFLNKLKNYDKQKFLDSIYKTEMFIPVRTGCSLDNFRAKLVRAGEISADEMKNKDFTGAYFTMYYNLLYLFYNHQVNTHVTNFCETAMQDAAGKPFMESAQILRAAFDVILDPVKYEQQVLSAVAAH